MIGKWSIQLTETTTTKAIRKWMNFFRFLTIFRKLFKSGDYYGIGDYLLRENETVLA